MPDDFELPPNMTDASPDDVQRVLDAIDILYIDNPSAIEPSGLDSASPYYAVFEAIAKRHNLTTEQLNKYCEAMMPPLVELKPVEDILSFTVRRYTEIGSFTQAIIIRDFGDEKNAARSVGDRANRMIGENPESMPEDAHIHLWSGNGARRLTLDFDYDLPGARRATVDDCFELVRHLSKTAIIGLR